MRESGPEPLQFNWFRATVRLYNSLIQCNSTTASTKVLHADMRLSSRYDDCWFSHIFSAMAGLIQGCMVKEKLRNCESIDLCKLCKPCESIDLSRFVVDSWSFRHPILTAAHESTTAKFSLTTDGVHCPPKRLWLLFLPTTLANFSLTSHEMPFAVFPVSDCVSTPFALRPQCGTPDPPPPVICVKLMMMSKMNSMLFSTVHTPIQCLFAADMSPYSQRQEHRMFTF